MVGIRIYDELSFWQVLFNQNDADRDNDDVLVAMHDSWDVVVRRLQRP
jgi:hypothetical protein